MDAFTRRMRAARESSVQVNGHRYTIRRPTAGELMQRDYEESGLAVLEDFVVGWDLLQQDALPGQGSDDAAPFNRDTWIEYLYDHSEIWQPLGEAIRKAMDSHKVKQGEAEKKSQSG